MQPLIPRLSVPPIGDNLRPAFVTGGIMAETRLTVRVDFGSDRAIGPGKVRLLEAIHDTGSISEAGRRLGMSYRRAWLLVDDMNRCFRELVVSAQPGGNQGGGAMLTGFGAELVRSYRAIVADATAATEARVHALEAALRASGRGAVATRKLSRRG
jgi:molybdate transport system regulatory protein